MHVLNAQNLKLREKVKNNLNTAERKFGYLKHNLNSYLDCIPLINAD